MKLEFIQKIEILNTTQIKMKIELKHPIAQLENSKRRLISGMTEAEDRISDFKDKIEDLYQISKGHEKLQNKQTTTNPLHTDKEHTENVGHHEKSKHPNYGHRIYSSISS